MAHGDGTSGGNDGRYGVAMVRRICEACVQTLPITGAAASIMTADGHRGVVHATDDTARSLEDVQFTVGDGPGCDAFATGRPVLIPDLADGPSLADEDWSAFRDVASGLGVRAVFSFPLHLGAAALGALTGYGVEPGTLDGVHLASAVRLSDACAVAVLDTIVGATGGDLPASDEWADGAEPEFFRAEVYQAAGMLTVQLGVSIEVATVRLRSHAFSTGRPLADVARDIVRRNLRLEADND